MHRHVFLVWAWAGAGVSSLGVVGHPFIIARRSLGSCESPYRPRDRRREAISIHLPAVGDHLASNLHHVHWGPISLDVVDGTQGTLLACLVQCASNALSHLYIVECITSTVSISHRSSHPTTITSHWHKGTLNLSTTPALGSG